MVVKSKKIGLFFGSFNPVHIGHMIIANFMVEQTDLNEVWMIVSPHNPLKKKSSLAKNRERLHMVRLAIGDNIKIKASDIEFNMPIPSYTIDTLTYLKERYNYHDFVLLMGGDNLITLPKWKNYEKLISEYQIYVYSRPNYDISNIPINNNISIFENTPKLDLSASFIRQCIKEGKSIQYMVSDAVFEYIDGSNLYKK